MTELKSHQTESTWVALIQGPLDTNQADAFVRDEDAGAIVLFCGTTRRRTDGRETVRLDYEAYEDMALATMQRLSETARERWPIRKLALLHATGTVAPKEASVCAAVSTPHRSEAFDAARFLIDELKRDVTIWKKEILVDGSEEWVEPGSPMEDTQ